MTNPTGAKVDYQDFNDDTTEFVKKLKRVMADINIRVAAVENVKGMVDEFERRYGEVALVRIDAAIAPILQEVVLTLSQAQSDLAEIDDFYRVNGMERVDSIINPLIAETVAALAAADAKVIELNAFLASKQSIAQKGQPGGYAALDAEGKVPSHQLPPPPALNKAAVGLDQVDNTSDADKPASTAVANALAGKEPANGNLLKSNASATLTKGFIHTQVPIGGGTVSSGTITIVPEDGHFQAYSNGGAHTLALPADNTPCRSMCVRITNSATAGTVTITGALKVTGDPLNVTSGKVFLLYLNMLSSTKHVHVVAMN